MLYAIETTHKFGELIEIERRPDLMFSEHYLFRFYDKFVSMMQIVFSTAIFYTQWGQIFIHKPKKSFFRKKEGNFSKI